VSARPATGSPAPSERPPRTSLPVVATLVLRGGCRSTRPPTVAAASSPRSSPASTGDAWYRAEDRQDAERRLDHFLAAVERAQLPAFTAFADGVRLWRAAELLAYFDEPTTNGHAEGVINKIKVIKRRAYGLPNFDGFRARVLLACA
jgi:transposase